ncbi:MAG: hypothetical protein EZS28_041859 [Streblomastix strix]|uniref:Uncharacterized protein n=1 Tax=Streblomastix strix TaxID=222440 RepID=A0A5J4TWD7_9EUKA|nr:MAG: hypothetical protein EZS28_041859 [Streblomastix strix]
MLPPVGDNICISPFGASFFLFYYETLPLGPLPPDPLLVFGVGHLKNSESDVNKCQDEGGTFPAFEPTSYSSYAVVYSARNHLPAERARNQSIFDRPRDTITERRSFKVATGYSSNEHATRSQKGR